MIYTKSPTTYDNLVDGILDCFRKAKVRPAEASLVNHGTTLVGTAAERPDKFGRMPEHFFESKWGPYLYVEVAGSVEIDKYGNGQGNCS